VRPANEYQASHGTFSLGPEQQKAFQVWIWYGVLIWILFNLLFAAVVVWRRVLAVPARRPRPAELAELNDWRI
jgi:hypothetical protein